MACCKVPQLKMMISNCRDGPEPESMTENEIFKNLLHKSLYLTDEIICKFLQLVEEFTDFEPVRPSLFMLPNLINAHKNKNSPDLQIL